MLSSSSTVEESLPLLRKTFEVEDSLPALLRKSLAELVGTFIFVFFIGMSKRAHLLQPFVPAFSLVFLKFSLAHISLAALNPALSLALVLRGVLSWKTLIFYIVAELLGGALGACMAAAFTDKISDVVILQIQSGIGFGFLAEFLGTFVLVFVSMNNTSANLEGNSFFGLSAGLCLGVIVLIFDPVSNACVNPSVAMLSLVGAPLHGHPIPPSIWVYFVAPFVGATCAAFLFRVISPNDHAPARFLFKGPVDHRDQTAPHSSTRLPEIQ